MALNLDLARKKAKVSKADRETLQKKRVLRRTFMKTIIQVFTENRKDIEEILTSIGYTEITLTKLNRLALKEYPDYLAISFALYRNSKQCFINLRCDDNDSFLTISNIGYRIEKKTVFVPTSEDTIETIAEAVVETTVNYMVDLFEDLYVADQQL